MHRLMAITALALFLAVPLWAQRGGGPAGGGHGGGFSGHAGFGGGHMGGVHVSGGMRAGYGGSRGVAHSPSSFARYPQRNFSRGVYAHNGFHGNPYRHAHHNHVYFYGIRNNCYGYGCRGYGYPWAYGAYYDPSWWGDSGSSYNEDYERERQIANQMNQQSLEEQRMRQQAEDDPPENSNDRYARSAPAARETESAPVPPTMLVFRDQHQQEVRNYAIVGQTLWNFASQRTQKIPLSDLDLVATTKANDERGLTFRVPASGEAQ
jgi:hypothetical protein